MAVVSALNRTVILLILLCLSSASVSARSLGNEIAHARKLLPTVAWSDPPVERDMDQYRDHIEAIVRRNLHQVDSACEALNFIKGLQPPTIVLTLKTDGSVKSVEILKSSGDRQSDDETLEAAKQGSYPQFNFPVGDVTRDLSFVFALTPQNKDESNSGVLGSVNPVSAHDSGIAASTVATGTTASTDASTSESSQGKVIETSVSGKVIKPEDATAKPMGETQ